MDHHIEQQQLDMADYTKKSMHSVINQVPRFMQSVFRTMGRVLNVALMQLQGVI
jgi:hypothetical protein